MGLKKIISFAAAMMLSFTSLQYGGINKTTDAADDNKVYFNSFDTSVNGGETIRGVDISSIIAIEKAGVKFYDDNGKEQDIFRTLAEHGVNYIRVRVWNEPYDSNGNSYGGGNSDVYTAGLIGKRAAEYGIKLLVDIQYSDFWADPEKQTRPKYWSSHDHETLKNEIYKWTSWVLQSVTDAGGDIGMVQVGNETNCFFCGETDMYKICDLFASGNKAVRDFDKNILIAHHFANPSNADYYLWYAKVMSECKLDYDVFATSYYPYWHGTMDNLTSVMKKIGDTYNKYVMVAETAYPYTSEDGDTFGNAVSAGSTGCDFRYDISVEGQAKCLTDVFQAVANMGGHGIGVFYWEPAWLGVNGIQWSQQKELWDKYGSGWATAYAAEYDKSVNGSGGSSYDNQALFDFSGKPLESLDVFNNIYPKKEKDLLKTGSEIPSGVYRFKNVNSGLYLTVANGEGLAGNNVVQYTADGAADYNTWIPESAGDGYYRIYSAIDGGKKYMLDLDGGKADDKTNIGIYTDTKADAQLFKFVKQSDGSYVIFTKSSRDKSAVEIGNALGTDGANAQQFAENGHDCQKWMLEAVEDYYLTGDINGDGKINSFDLAMLRRCVINAESPKSADLNNDGRVNIADVVAMSNRILGRNGFEAKEHGTPHNTIRPEVR